MASREIQLGKVLWSSDGATEPAIDNPFADYGYAEDVEPASVIEELMDGSGFNDGVAVVLVNRAAEVRRGTGACGAEVLLTDPTKYMLMSPVERTIADYTGLYSDDFSPDDQPDVDIVTLPE